MSLISPDSTPLYNFAIYDPDGFYLAGGVDIDSQKTDIEKQFQLRGECSLVITGAVDDGDYKVRIIER